MNMDAVIIGSDEIERMLARLDEPLRKRWELKHYCKGKSLLDLGQERKKYLARECDVRKKSSTNSTVALLLMVVFVLCLAVGPAVFHGWTALLRWGIIIPVSVALIVCFVIKYRYDRSEEALDWNIGESNRIFGDLQRSINSLAPLGTGDTYGECITEASIEREAVKLAVRILESQKPFEVFRFDPDIPRNVVINSAKKIEQCESTFDTFWTAATEEFCPTLDKHKVIRLAAAQLAKK